MVIETFENLYGDRFKLAVTKFGKKSNVYALSFSVYSYKMSEIIYTQMKQVPFLIYRFNDNNAEVSEYEVDYGAS